MYLPAATYRIQFSKTFPFRALKEILPYLHDLGVTTIYASPIFQARPGSEHGYDIVSPLTLNSEIGTLEEFRELNAILKKYGMSWLQDIVPNHMAYHADNPWLWDVLEKSSLSKYYQFFDINWEDTDPKYNGKVMAPFLGNSLDEVLSKREIKLKFTEQGFLFKYFEHTYPLSCSSYFMILNQEKSEKAEPYFKLLNDFREFERIVTKSGKWDDLKNRLYQLVQNDSKIKKAIDDVLGGYNENIDKLRQLLEQQNFVLTHWKTTEQHINYRRFFTINDLICLSMEQEKVFNDYHQFIKKLWDDGLIQGLRVDHVDGLFDPEGYLNQLRKMIGQDGYLIVEKILEWDESLPDWPVQGSSGYEFLALFNALYTDARSQDAFSKLYKSLSPKHADYDSLAYKKKRFMLQARLGGELNNLMQLLQGLDIPLDQSELKNALTAFLAAFPVYRTYINQWPISQQDLGTLNFAFGLAKQQEPEMLPALTELRKVLVEHDVPAERQDQLLYFLMRCQQVTSPLAAKGIEDTTFYIFNRLIAHNEVGASPSVFGLTIERFHKRLQQRMATTPHALNTTATHDTKRGEDVRTCLNVLSEMPEAWENHTKEWMRINQKFKEDADGQPVPSANEEYFLYQTLVGVVPVDGKIDRELIGRIQKYMVKALREAKVHSSWSKQDVEYERKVCKFIEMILEDDSFKEAFLPFLKNVSHYGAIYSLAQVVLKIAAPGIPDFYQGTELWNLCMVDPDNRRPVDYKLRVKYLKELQQKAKADIGTLISDMKNNLEDGRLKLYTLYKSLQFRKEHPKLFAYGKYIPLAINGDRSHQVTGFLRQHNNDWCMLIIPRLLSSVIPEGKFPEDEAIWGNTSIHLPNDAPDIWQHVFTEKKYRLSNTFALSDVYRDFPVVLLVSRKARQDRKDKKETLK